VLEAPHLIAENGERFEVALSKLVGTGGHETSKNDMGKANISQYDVMFAMG
jgi:hypothetical protein